MQDVMPLAHRVGALLKARKETVAVAESSAGGIVAAALLAVPGASQYFLGGAVLYTRPALMRLLHVREDALSGMRPVTEAYALFQARQVREQLSSTWGLAENGAAGPAPNRYGDAPGRTCVAVTGPFECSLMIDTGEDDRLSNMYAFATAALQLLEQALAGQGGA